MRSDSYEDLPDELNPLYARKRSMYAIGQWMAAIGTLLLLVGAVSSTLVLVESLGVETLFGLDHVATVSVLGGVVLLLGVIAIVVTDAM